MEANGQGTILLAQINSLVPGRSGVILNMQFSIFTERKKLAYFGMEILGAMNNIFQKFSVLFYCLYYMYNALLLIPLIISQNWLR